MGGDIDELREAVKWARTITRDPMEEEELAALVVELEEPYVPFGLAPPLRPKKRGASRRLCSG